MSVILQDIVREINEKIESSYAYKGWRSVSNLGEIVINPILKKHLPEYDFTTRQQLRNDCTVRVALTDKGKSLGSAFLFAFKVKSRKVGDRMHFKSIEILPTISDMNLSEIIKLEIEKVYSNMNKKDSARNAFNGKLKSMGLTRDQFNELLLTYKYMEIMSSDELYYKANEILENYDFGPVKEGKEVVNGLSDAFSWRIDRGSDIFNVWRHIYFNFTDGSHKSFEFHIDFALDGYVIRTFIANEQSINFV